MAPQPFVPLVDGVQAEFIFSLAGEVVENRLWFVDRTGPTTQARMNALAIALHSWHQGQVMPFLAVELALQQVVITDWSAFPPPMFSTVTSTTFGSVAGGVHSANVSVRVAFKGASTQTFRNNSNFVPGIPKASVDGNQYSSTIRTALFNAYVNLIDLVAGVPSVPGWRWVITSRRLANSWRSTQDFSRTDFIRFPSPYISPRRRRLP